MPLEECVMLETPLDCAAYPLSPGGSRSSHVSTILSTLLAKIDPKLCKPASRGATPLRYRRTCISSTACCKMKTSVRKARVAAAPAAEVTSSAGSSQALRRGRLSAHLARSQQREFVGRSHICSVASKNCGRSQEDERSGKDRSKDGTRA